MKINFNISEEEWEEIEQFLANKWPTEKTEVMKKRIAEDPELAGKVAHVRAITLGIREAALESALKNISLKEQHAPMKKLSGGKRFFIGWISAAAAVIVAVVLIFSGVFKKSDSRLFSKYYYPDSGLISSMGVSDEYDFDVAMIDYKSGKYAKAIEQMEKLRKANLNSDTLNYFIGNSYLALGESERAIPYLKEVTKNNESVFAKDANWYLGLAYLKSGQKADAVTHISQSENEKKDELLKEIEK